MADQLDNPRYARFEAYDDRAYESVVDKLTRLHMDSSYLFSYDSAVINLKTDKWTPPKTIKLKSYHNGAEAIILPPEEQEISSDQIFSNKFLPQDRRFSMVVSPLFSNEEHYGLLMCELKHEYFHYIQSVTVQLCAALKIIMLMKQQAVTRKNLQRALSRSRSITSFSATFPVRMSLPAASTAAASLKSLENASAMTRTTAQRL